MKIKPLPIPGGIAPPKAHVDVKVDLAIEERCKKEARAESNASLKRLAEKYGSKR